MICIYALFLNADASVDKAAANLPTPAAASTKRKRAALQSKKAIEDDPDVLPHGLGKKGDLLKYAGENAQVATFSGSPVKKRARPSTLAADRKTYMANDNRGDVKSKDSDIKIEETKIKVEATDPVTNELLEEVLSGKGKGKHEALKTKEDIKHEEKLEKTTPAKKRTPRKKQVLDTSNDVLNKVDDLIEEPGLTPKTKPKKKHPYGLTPGASPFPGHVKPTYEDCEEVHRLLTELHGEHKAPDKIPAPSLHVSGCGEVPDLLDALMRTLLSASTNASNANKALAGLTKAFGLRESGIGKGSVNWEAVYKADLSLVKVAILAGGLADTKSRRIKEILDIVHEQNCIRRDALVKEIKTGDAADIAGATRATEEQKEKEIAMANESLLSMDYIFEMTTDEAMDEMTKLPGIGVKTASCVILFCMKRPSFAVDTHVWRHCKWLNWVPSTATRDKTFSHCEVRIPDHLKYGLHQLFLKHGKKCGRCQAKTSAGTEEWEETVCPIEHLVVRTGAKKQPGFKPPKKEKVSRKGKATKKRKKIIDDESEGDQLSEESEASDSEREE